MLKELRETYVYKFDSPMTAYLYYRGNEGWWDEETGSVEWEAWYGRIGRRIVFETDQGFVGSARYSDEAYAIEAMDDIRRDYDEWDDWTEDDD